jgi:hypothetical protein
VTAFSGHGNRTLHFSSRGEGQQNEAALLIPDIVGGRISGVVSAVLRLGYDSVSLEVSLLASQLVYWLELCTFVRGAWKFQLFIS